MGFEIDLVTSQKISEYVDIQAGYSQYFASKGIKFVKNNFDGNTNNWAWVMLTIDPVLFTFQKQDIENKQNK
ncbi:MAG: hypothetical protein JJE55_03875 [Flavobacteriaceae bacterium]|nr:hypothetical protein [Flavobacteriaceae bacterium]